MVTHDQEEALTMADRIVVMNKGRIEQSGRPLEIYARPASLFIADFVGTMNMVRGTATGDGRVRLGGLELACGEGLDPGASVTVCWRPEDVVVGAQAAGSANPVQARIEGVEFLGPYHRAILRARGLDAPFSADLSAHLVRDLGLASGQELQVGLPAACLHVFPEPLT
jgi:iron(III) transport system ATP-binding protein